MCVMRRYLNLKRKWETRLYAVIRAFLVNMKYIRRIENKSFMLENGEEILISKSRYVETKNRYFAYLTRIEK